MNGSEPPSSSTVFFTACPASSAIREPVAVLPVSVTARTRSSAMTGSTAAPGTRSTRRRSFGKPASRTASSIASAHWGTLEACLRRAAFPAMNAGARNRTTCQNGKFHGITARITPSGSNATRLSRALVATRSSARYAAACSA